MITSAPWRGRLPDKLSGLHVLAILVAFFGTIFVVNGLFIFRALSTYTGEVANEPYRKGLAYNARIAAEERQRLLGWVDVTTVARDGTIAVRVNDAGGAPLTDLALSGFIGRPSTDRQDHVLKFSLDGNGQYVAHASALDAGTWVVTLKAARAAAADETLYQSKRRIWLTP